MEMSRATYDAILARVKQLLYKNDCVKQLVSIFPNVPEQTLQSIYSQHYQLSTKQNHASHRRQDNSKTYYEKYLKYRKDGADEEKDLILKMADEVQLSPVLFARIILEQSLVEQNIDQPHNKIATSRDFVSQWIKDPRAIPDPILQMQVRHCIVNDTNYGPLAENIKHSIGHEYEFLLQDQLHQLGVPFLDEHSLRGRGYDKTPDFKLDIPLAINGYVINWIESKASFGDDHTHCQYLDDQFWSYQNRFGPGAVIYWMGFVSELDSHREQGILLLSNLPHASSIQTFQHTMS